MHLKEVVKLILPPIALSASRALQNAVKGAASSKPEFEGVYSDFDSIKLPSGAGFATNEGVKWALEKAQLQREKSCDWLATGNLIPGDHFLVALINLLMVKKARVKIYDVGGGVGNTYFSVRPYFCHSNFHWFVIDQPPLVTEGEELLKEEKRVSISERLPEQSGVDDHVSKVGLIRAALQYFPDPKLVIEELVNRKMDYILFIRLPAGDVPDYFTIQNFRQTPHPFRLFNLTNFLVMMNGLEYELVYRCGDSEFFDMSNFPPELRLQQSITLGFARKGI